MLDNIKSKVQSPEFRNGAIRIGGSVVSFVTTLVIANVVNSVIEAGVNALIEKMSQTETPAE